MSEGSIPLNADHDAIHRAIKRIIAGRGVGVGQLTVELEISPAKPSATLLPLWIEGSIRTTNLGQATGFLTRLHGVNGPTSVPDRAVDARSCSRSTPLKYQEPFWPIPGRRRTVAVALPLQGSRSRVAGVAAIPPVRDRRNCAWTDARADCLRHRFPGRPRGVHAQGCGAVVGGGGGGGAVVGGGGGGGAVVGGGAGGGTVVTIGTIWTVGLGVARTVGLGVATVGLWVVGTKAVLTGRLVAPAPASTGGSTFKRCVDVTGGSGRTLVMACPFPLPRLAGGLVSGGGLTALRDGASAVLARPGVFVPTSAVADSAMASARRHDVTMNRRVGVRSANQLGCGKVSTLRVRMVASSCLVRGHGLILGRRRAARSSHQPNVKTRPMRMSQDTKYIWR